MVASAVEKWGRLDIMVANAGGPSAFAASLMHALAAS